MEEKNNIWILLIVAAVAVVAIAFVSFSSQNQKIQGSGYGLNNEADSVGQALVKKPVSKGPGAIEKDCEKYHTYVNCVCFEENTYKVDITMNDQLKMPSPYFKCGAINPKFYSIEERIVPEVNNPELWTGSLRIAGNTHPFSFDTSSRIFSIDYRNEESSHHYFSTTFEGEGNYFYGPIYTDMENYPASFAYTEITFGENSIISFKPLLIG